MITYFRWRSVDNTHSIGYTYDTVEEAFRDMIRHGTHSSTTHEQKYYLLLCKVETINDNDGFLTETVTTTRVGIYTYSSVVRMGLTGI